MSDTQISPRAVAAMPDRYLTTDELCVMLGIRPQTAAKWRCSGDGPPFTRVGRCVRYSLAAVNEYLARRTGASTAALDAAQLATA